MYPILSKLHLAARLATNPLWANAEGYLFLAQRLTSGSRQSRGFSNQSPAQSSHAPH